MTTELGPREQETARALEQFLERMWEATSPEAIRRQQAEALARHNAEHAAAQTRRESVFFIGGIRRFWRTKIAKRS